MSSLVCKGQQCLPFLWTLAIWNRCISCGFSNDMVEQETFLTSGFHYYLMGPHVSRAVVDSVFYSAASSPLSHSLCTALDTAACTAWKMLFQIKSYCVHDSMLYWYWVHSWNGNFLCTIRVWGDYVSFCTLGYLWDCLLFMLYFKLMLVHADFKCVCHIPLVTMWNLSVIVSSWVFCS